MTIIKNDEHVLVSGITGSGKTHFIKTYLAGKKNVIKLDTKGESLIDLDNGDHPWTQVPSSDLIIFTDFGALKEHDFNKKSKVIYVPDFEELDSKDFYEDFFEWSFFKFYDKRNPFVLWVDELKDVVPSASYIPKYMRAFLSKGRHVNSTLWMATQEPRHMPSVTISQPTHIIAFDLPRIEDRRRLADNSGVSQFLEPLPKYHFWYFKRGWTSAKKGMLES